MGLFKRFRKEAKPAAQTEPTPQAEQVLKPQPETPAPKIRSVAKKSTLAKLKTKLSKTRQQLGGVGKLLTGKAQVDDDVLDELEMALITADVGVEVSEAIIGELHGELSRKALTNGDQVFAALQTKLQAKLDKVAQPLEITAKKPYVILFVGVNGAGKTTTIGKLAKQLQKQGKSVMLAAGDTFRAAAVEQLQVWGERNKIPVIAQHTGADSAAVIFDAFESAKAKGVDVLIADTAGRLHTQSHLLDELKKVARVLKKQDESVPHEVMLVLDANMGQNALVQAREFHKAVNLTGITMTKLDGTAKGGIVFAIADELNIPIRFIGVGEAIDDLESFDSEAFVAAVLNK